MKKNIRKNRPVKFVPQKEKVVHTHPQKKSSNGAIFYFLIKFLVIFSILNVLIETTNLSVLTQFIASFVASVMGLTSVSNSVLVNGSIFVITNSCTGLVSASILASVIFALKKPSLAKKTVLFFTGLVILLVVNIPRIMLVLLVAKAGFDPELVHEITWFVMSAIILIIWYYGTKRILSKEEFSDLI
jgi:exosortase/archaeosortase family protein